MVAEVTHPTEEEYAWGWALARRLGDEIRAREAVADRLGRDMEKARKAYAAAHEEAREALRPWRELVIALTDGAGHDGKHPLGPAVDAALEVLQIQRAEIEQVEIQWPDPLPITDDRTDAERLADGDGPPDPPPGWERRGET